MYVLPLDMGFALVVLLLKSDPSGQPELVGPGQFTSVDILVAHHVFNLSYGSQTCLPGKFWFNNCFTLFSFDIKLFKMQ